MNSSFYAKSARIHGVAAPEALRRSAHEKRASPQKNPQRSDLSVMDVTFFGAFNTIMTVILITVARAESVYNS